MSRVSKVELMPDVLLEDKIRLYTIQIDDALTELENATREYKSSILHKLRSLGRSRNKYLKEQNTRMEHEAVEALHKMESEFKKLVDDLLAKPLPSMLPNSQ